jgi:F1F0 ATPase subunit 2
MSLLLALVAGVLFGAFFFGGLWWTVRRSIASPRPGIWFIGSMLLRTCVVTGGFYFLLGLPASGEKILFAAMLGFIIARAVATQFLPTPLSPSLVRMHQPGSTAISTGEH